MLTVKTRTMAVVEVVQAVAVVAHPMAVKIIEDHLEAIKCQAELAE
jgi:hypothetical protein